MIITHTKVKKWRKGNKHRTNASYNTRITCRSCTQPTGPLLRLQLKRREPYFCVYKFIIGIYVCCIRGFRLYLFSTTQRKQIVHEIFASDFYLATLFESSNWVFCFLLCHFHQQSLNQREKWRAPVTFKWRREKMRECVHWTKYKSRFRAATESVFVILGAGRSRVNNTRNRA